MKILIVDDDCDYVAGVQFVLEANKYEVFAAYSKNEGLSKLKDVQPDIILLDIMMGRSADGILFARKIKCDAEYRTFSNIPILVITGMREKTGFWFPGDPKNPIFFPVDEIMEKPVKPAALLKKVEYLLDKKNA